MNSKAGSPLDPKVEARMRVEVARQLQRLADQAIEEARAACERANDLPLLAGLLLETSDGDDVHR